ncbi:MULTISPECIES: type I-B CRISPR-associated protein Cas5b [Halomicrobium]|uniref:CRISPR-associated protein Cas5, Hmari subtype n=2 Tax=Halomicrobium mukohataei TaxID=57705 RepID=C7P0E8_HALMD|nr:MULTISPECIES: type I-B CRISPR-associated protein Cas5b [Halomicrobium]ACV48940.1 CRISPR-associated protein Cas5, Hmari subtype [Halomicrobium mukohataei DSM 12286]QCD64364.1 type I-B CRISPR-associated protein Cas5 [Halomicrobium mukohataei]QFR19170.1 type I-B CRISPR-associated protein Cas5 [Halomicrobium sp. ZPS1]
MSEHAPTASGLPDGAETCLSFTVSGPWGHFRRIEGNIVKQTYRVIPRTTVAGLIAAMLGIERDGYYDLFAPGESLVAIEPTSELRTMKLPMNTLSTADEHMASLNPRGKLSIKLPDPSKPRQQHNYEVLVEPAYRIDVWLADDERYDRLRSLLESGESYYVPSLGLSEHLATIDYHGEFPVEHGPDGETVAIDSTVPEAVDSIVPDPETRYQIEQTPAFMERDDGGRTTSAFVSYAYNPDGGSLRVADVSTYSVDDRAVVFT